MVPFERHFHTSQVVNINGAVGRVLGIDYDIWNANLNMEDAFQEFKYILILKDKHLILIPVFYH